MLPPTSIPRRRIRYTSPAWLPARVAARASSSPSASISRSARKQPAVGAGDDALFAQHHQLRLVEAVHGAGRGDARRTGRGGQQRVERLRQAHAQAPVARILAVFAAQRPGRALPGRAGRCSHCGAHPSTPPSVRGPPGRGCTTLARARAGYGVPALKAASDPVFVEGPFKDKNWKLIPDGLNYDVPLANNPIADQFKNELTRIPAERFLANEIKAREFLDQGCQEVDNKIRELGWRKKGG